MLREPFNIVGFAFLCVDQNLSEKDPTIPPSPPPSTLPEVWAFAVLDSWNKSYVNNPPPSKKKIWDFVILSVLDSGTKVQKWFNPAPHLRSLRSPENIGLCNVISFGLRNRSWNVGETPTRPLKIWDFNTGSRIWSRGPSIFFPRFCQCSEV